MKKKKVKHSPSRVISSTNRKLDEHVKWESQKYDDLHEKISGITSRLDGWNGAIPFIKDAVKNLQDSVEVIHNKIDIVSQVNASQDQRIARAEEITDWVRRVFIIGGAMALVSGLGAVIWKVVLSPWLLG